MLHLRSYVVIVATKPKDPTLEALQRNGWTRIEKWPPPKGARKVLLWPKFKAPEYEAGQVKPITDAMAAIFEDGGWCVYFDEIMYIVDDLKLKHWPLRMWRQGSTLGITVVAGTQRPVDVPLDMYSAPTYLVFFRTNDRRDLDRLVNIGGADRDAVRDAVPRLERHEVLVVNTRTGDMLRTRVDLPGRKPR